MTEPLLTTAELWVLLIAGLLLLLALCVGAFVHELRHPGHADDRGELVDWPVRGAR